MERPKAWRLPERWRSTGPTRSARRLRDRRNSANSRHAGHGRSNHRRHPLVHDNALCILRSRRRAGLYGLAVKFHHAFHRQAEAGRRYRPHPSDILASISGIQALTPDQFRQQSRSFWLFDTGAGAALFAGALLGVIVGTVIVAQTLYSSTKDHLYEFATLRAMGASNNYIFKVIISQAMLSAIIGFVIAALIGTAVVHFTASSAVQVVITANLMLELLVLTVLMSVASALASIVRVVRVDPAIVLTR